jgi:hypothetical protein
MTARRAAAGPPQARQGSATFIASSRVNCSISILQHISLELNRGDRP